MEPSIIIQAPQYCPICGHDRVGVTLDSEQDFWEAMAQTYNMKIKLLQLLYDMWLEEQPRKHYRFGDYIKDAVK